MISNVCVIEPGLAGVARALRETEKCAVYCELTEKQTLRLRLLAEELLGVLRGVLYDYDAEFFIQTEGGNFELHLRAHGDMDITVQEREQFLSIATSGKNEAAKGIMGKIRQLFEWGIADGDAGMTAAGSLLYTGGAEYDTYMLPNEWSLQRYRAMLDRNRTDNAEAWDELEKSIVANLADDVTVAVRGDTAEIVIKKSFA